MKLNGFDVGYLLALIVVSFVFAAFPPDDRWDVAKGCLGGGLIYVVLAALTRRRDD